MVSFCLQGLQRAHGGAGDHCQSFDAHLIQEGLMKTNHIDERYLWKVRAIWLAGFQVVR